MKKLFFILLVTMVCLTSCAPVGVIDTSRVSTQPDITSVNDYKTCTYSTGIITNSRDIESVVAYE